MRYYKIIKDDVLNGVGFRTTLVITRCQFNCFGCHAAGWGWLFSDATAPHLYQCADHFLNSKG